MAKTKTILFIFLKYLGLVVKTYNMYQELESSSVDPRLVKSVTFRLAYERSAVRPQIRNILRIAIPKRSPSAICMYLVKTARDRNTINYYKRQIGNYLVVISLQRLADGVIDRCVCRITLTVRPNLIDVNIDQIYVEM